MSRGKKKHTSFKRRYSQGEDVAPILAYKDQIWKLKSARLAEDHKGIDAVYELSKGN